MTPSTRARRSAELRCVTRHGGEVGICGTCMDARGIADGELFDATRRSSLDQLTDWTQWADRGWCSDDERNRMLGRLPE